jgi:LPXTG-site transpeptidase (sortase) family protein
MIAQLVQELNTLVLIVGVLISIGVLLLIRSRQVADRGLLGYNRRATRRSRGLVAWAGIATAAVLGIGVLYWWVNRPAPPPAPEAEPVVAEEEPFPEVSLVIPQIGIEAEMIEAPFVARQWDISRLTDEVAHLAGTAFPGDSGNAVLAGHITIPGAGWGPFQELEILEPGDRIFIERDGETYVYEVTELMVVDRTEVSVAFPTEDTRLTLITCSGWDEELDDYVQRIVVVAHLVTEEGTS